MIKTTHKQLLEEILAQVYNNSLFSESMKYMQHGSTSIYRHSIMVAYKSCEIAEKYHLKVSYSEMIRGALLHDYFLYISFITSPVYLRLISKSGGKLTRTGKRLTKRRSGKWSAM